MRNASTALAPLAALVIIVLAAGCGAGALPQRYPSRSPTGMTSAQAEADERACVSVAARATTERAWAYIGCMVSREHTVGVAFHVKTEATYLGVSQTRPHDQSAVASELDNCRQSAYAAGRSAGPTREAIVDRMEAGFRSCVGPLGYMVQRDGAPAPGRAGQ